jgi:ABC-type dipeptide/oligopeptide/nickel transport system permease component
MLVFIIRRSLQSVVVLFAMSLLVFVGVYAIGNPIDVLFNPQADQIDRERSIAALGLDRSLWAQYASFLSGALTGNLGRSFVHSTSALGLILERMPATMELALVAMLVAIVVGVPLGLWAGLKPHGVAGRTIMTGSILGFSLPPARIVFRHLLPNCLPPMIVVATVQVAHAITLEATLSFLGLGLPITEPSLGLLIANGYQYLLSGKYWISFFPGVALLFTIVGINRVADPLRDVLNPRLQR